MGRPAWSTHDLQSKLELEPTAVLHEVEGLLPSRREPALFRIAAEACRRLGFLDDAEDAELAGIQSGLSDPRLTAAASALEAGQASEALRITTEFLGSFPDDLLGLTLAAEAQIALWQLDGAESKLGMVLSRAPSFLRASMLMSMCLVKQVRAREAVQQLNAVIARKPNNVTALARLAQLQATLRDADEALGSFEALVKLEPAKPDRWVDLAHQYRALGRRADAIECFRQAIARDQANGAAWWSLANYFKDEITEEDEQSLANLIEQVKEPVAASPLVLALGLIKDRKKEYPEAFDLLKAGKAARLAVEPADATSLSKSVSELIGILSPDFVTRQSSVSSQAQPIFMVGLPRSGTTLVERILGRHTAIEAVGEIPVLRRCVERTIEQAANRAGDAESLTRLGPEELASLSGLYLRASRDYRQTDKPFFVDKSNINWMHAGLILAAFPNAKIIDVRRNALDCCWANFKVLYPAGFPEANDLEAIGRFYAEYVRMIEAAKNTAPDRILTIRYEDVIEDIGAATRRILHFLDLPYQPACLDFHLSTEVVATPSSEQVRQPLNRRGIGSSKPYAQWLQPLRDALGPLADA